MQTVQGTASTKMVTSHALFLANVSRHFVSLEIEPMLEAVGRSALCVLGDICVVDRIAGKASTRILEVRSTQEAWIEAPSALASVTRGEIRLEGARPLAPGRPDRLPFRGMEKVGAASTSPTSSDFGQRGLVSRAGIRPKAGRAPQTFRRSRISLPGLK